MASAGAKAVPVLDINSLENWDPIAYAGQVAPAPWQSSLYDGAKFFGGFGETQLYEMDYWTLRARSTQLFTENMYARGIIRRLLTNEVNKGLNPESRPEELVLGYGEGELEDITDLIESRFMLWGSSAQVCDFKGRLTFGQLQALGRLESLVAGDALVVNRFDAVTGLPKVQVVSGECIQSPLMSSQELKLARGNRICEGVELDSDGKHVAFWIRQQDGLSFKRLPARRPDGRPLAWLVYGCEKRSHETRGMPLLGVILQSLKEIDRYRDSAQRQAVVASILAMFITREKQAPGTPFMTASAPKTGEVQTGSDGSKMNWAAQYPGLIAEHLEPGEKPEFNGGKGTDVQFAVFEAAIMQAIAWVNEIPPEILRLSFSNNYSASQAAINEFKIYLDKFWTEFGAQFCQPFYEDFLVAENLSRSIKMPGFIAAWKSRRLAWDKYTAWVQVDWLGQIKPSTDSFKMAKGSQLLLSLGLTTYAREARINTGTKFDQNIRRQRREVVKLNEARGILNGSQDGALNQATPDPEGAPSGS